MKVINDIKYGNIPGRVLDLYLPDAESFPVFVFFYGGALECGDKSLYPFFGEYLAKFGIASAMVNYRMYPEATYPDFIHDAAAGAAWVYKHIKEYGNCTGVYVGGSSAGGYLSQMICFDRRYLAPHEILPTDFKAFIHDAGQPTCHFNVLRERGIDKRRIIIDESAPLFHVGKDAEYPPMLIMVSDNDLENRYEQTMLLLSTLKHFGTDMSKIEHKVLHGSHCEYVFATREDGTSVYGDMIKDYILKMEQSGM
jgi:hypothetical protein